MYLYIRVYAIISLWTVLFYTGNALDLLKQIIFLYWNDKKSVFRSETAIFGSLNRATLYMQISNNYIVFVQLSRRHSQWYYKLYCISYCEIRQLFETDRYYYIHSIATNPTDNSLDLKTLDLYLYILKSSRDRMWEQNLI